MSKVPLGTKQEEVRLVSLKRGHYLTSPVPKPMGARSPVLLHLEVGTYSPSYTSLPVMPAWGDRGIIQQGCLVVL